MALQKEDEQVLEEILELAGDCLLKERCVRCPFRSKCLPEFLNPSPPPKNERFYMALDVIALSVLVDPNIDPSKVKIGQKNSKYIN